jgi:hypothetical protein
MQQYNITELRLGRNVGTQSMGLTRWSEFQADAIAALEFFAGTLEADEYWTEVHIGTGTYTDESGVTVVEESAVVTLYWSEHGLNDVDALARIALDGLENDAAIYATRYNQDAIAVVHGGRSTLVKAKAVAQ